MSSNTTQRDAFFDRLYELAREDKDIVIVAADMSAPALDKFRTELPGQFVNVGIAEQNAIQIASGLAMAGKKAFAYAISPFITLRCLEQIRVSNGIMKIPITIVGMGTGFSYCSDGPTHHLIEDLAVMRAFPNVRIMTITDTVMAAAAAGFSSAGGRTTYVRLDKDVYPEIYGPQDEFQEGVAKILDGDRFVVSCGPMLHVAREAIESLGLENVGLIDLYSLPVNARGLLACIEGAEALLTVEEHFLPGGLGSAVLETLCDHRIALPVRRVGMDAGQGYQYCYKYGGREVIRGHYGIDRESIARMIADFAQNEVRTKETTQWAVS